MVLRGRFRFLLHLFRYSPIQSAHAQSHPSTFRIPGSRAQLRQTGNAEHGQKGQQIALSLQPQRDRPAGPIGGFSLLNALAHDRHP